MLRATAGHVKAGAQRSCAAAVVTAIQGPLSPSDPEPRVFFFFSNRLGCLGSILVSIIGTVIVIFLINLLLR